MASALGALPVVGQDAAQAAANLPAPLQTRRAAAFPNGIDATKYVGGDGSYEKYREDGIRLGLIEAFPVNYTDKETGQRTGWNTDIVVAALGKSGITKIEFVEGPWESMVPGLQSGRFDLLASDVHVTPERVKIIDFSTPVFWYGDVLVVHEGQSRRPVHLGRPRRQDRRHRARRRTTPSGCRRGPTWKRCRSTRTPQTATADLVAGRIDGYIAEDANFTGFLVRTRACRSRTSGATCRSPIWPTGRGSASARKRRT